MPKNKRLTMTYSAEEKVEDELDGVERDPDGNVTIGVPLIVAAAVPPPDNEEETN